MRTYYCSLYGYHPHGKLESKTLIIYIGIDMVAIYFWYYVAHYCYLCRITAQANA